METVDSPAELKYFGLAVFKSDKLIGWLNDEESKVYSYLDNTVRNTVFHVNCPDNKRVALEVYNAHSKVKGSIRSDIPQINIEQRIEANLAEVQCKNLDLTNEKTITKLNQLTNHKVEGLFEHTIKKVQQEYKADIFGFGEVIHRSNPQAWKKLKDNWDETFVNLPVSVKVDNHIRQLGKVTNSFLEEMK